MLSMHSQITQGKVSVPNAGKESKCVKYMKAALTLVVNQSLLHMKRLIIGVDVQFFHDIKQC